MKRMITSALMLFVALSFGVAVSQGQKLANKAGLEKTVSTFFDAVKAGNENKMKTYYTADYTFTGPNGKLVGIEERLQVLKAPGNTFVSASEIAVRTYGGTGVVTGVATTTNTSGANEDSRFIQVWTWQSGRWRLAASQVTRIE